MRGRVLLLTAAAVLTVGAASPALAQTPYPPTTPSITIHNASGVTTTTLTIGASFTVDVTDLDSTIEYQLLISQSPPVLLTSGTSSSSGTIHFSAAIPTTAHAGPATLIVRGGGSDATAAIDLVTAGGGLPKTGQEIARMTMWGAVLIAIGIALLLVYRSRRSRRPADISA